MWNLQAQKLSLIVPLFSAGFTNFYAVFMLSNFLCMNFMYYVHIRHCLKIFQSKIEVFSICKYEKP